MKNIFVKQRRQVAMHTVTALIILVVAVCAEKANYTGYMVYRVHPADPEQVKLLARFSENEHFDFWSPLRFSAKPIDVMVHPYAQKVFEWFATSNEFQYDILIDDVERVVQQERHRQLMAPPVRKGSISFEKYNTYDEINNYIDYLAKKHKDIVTLEIIGTSFEGRDLKTVKISTDPCANKPIIFIDAGIHPREWVAPSQATYIINQLVENPNNRDLLDQVDWHVMPLVNPDGYEYSRNTDRFWRKTRSRGLVCYGVDGNRNFGHHWGEVGASTDECTDTYMGKSPFSEPETAAIKGYVEASKENIKLYVAIHTYGGYIFYPWAYTTELPDDYEELHAVGEIVADSIRSVAGTNYTVSTTASVLMPIAGGSKDWVKGGAGVDLSYILILPGGGSNGFDPPPTQIIPIVTETWEGFKAYHSYIQEKFGQKLN